MVSRLARGYRVGTVAEPFRSAGASANYARRRLGTNFILTDVNEVSTHRLGDDDDNDDQTTKSKINRTKSREPLRGDGEKPRMGAIGAPEMNGNFFH